MEKIKAFLAFLEASKFKLHRLANANLDMCYSKFIMEDLLSILAERDELAKDAGILSTDFYDGICHVQVTYEDFQRLTESIKEIRIEPSTFQELEHEHLFIEVGGVQLVAVRKTENKKMQAQ
ncbi:hypothetical protein ACQKEY_07165 [Lysinibacillus fusiformis]|uniref:hypothetical protein n=1 Tax=Lysinibacillus fusiformis TaxID=28031 RepID=UPI003D05CB33